MVHVSNWDKFTLLLWKNWILQWNKKIQVIIELLLPAIFSLLLVLVRALVVAEPRGITTYPELDIDNINLFRDHFKQAGRKKSFLNTISSNNGSKLISNKGNVLSYELLYSPNTTDIFTNIVSDAAFKLNLKSFSGYANAVDLEAALVEGNYFAGVQFDDALANAQEYPTKLAYSLRFPSELRTSTSNIALTWLTGKLFPKFGITGPRNREENDGGIPVGYLREGFLPLQHAISSAYLELAAKVEKLPEIQMQRFPYPAYIDDPLLEGLASIMALIIVLSFIYPCTYIVKNITIEKEKQLKEVMKIMGLPNWLHWTAWFVKSFIMLGISTTLILILTKVSWSHDVAVLTYSHWSALLFFLLIYVITSICFCFMIAVFFSKASTAAAVTGMLWFVAYLPFTFIMNHYDDLNLASKLGWSLVSNTALGLGFKLILGFEGNGEGLQWSNMFSPVSADDELTVGAVMLMMLVSCVIYMAICLYIEQIFPGDFGVAKKWNFPFRKRFWCGEQADYQIGVEDMTDGREQQQQNQRYDPEAFESEPVDKHIGMQVRNLRKEFGDKKAVKGLSMNLYEDEITVLLGHNGAGKTTTISMLTGIIPPTAGTAIINGSDIRTNIEGARMSLGICPQHNVLFDDLTVANHIVFFSRLKGLKGDEVRREVDKYLKIIQLEDKANIASSKLSGGMKRKLSVCAALCGRTKVVLCDEPSSGMDPAARRQLWDLLQAEKIGRTVLLTTHFMDEADVLGDRIAIMCDGELRCRGTSFFLKKKFGSGYRLICVKRDNCDSSRVTQLLQRYIPELEPEREIGAELFYLLPDSYSSIFKEMFAALEKNSDNLNLNGYGIGISSLEEVFVKFGAEKAVNSEPQKQLNGGTTGFVEDDTESITSDSLFSDHRRSVKGCRLFINQWNAMILKKYLYSLRNKLMFVIQNALPIFFVVNTVLIARSQGTFNHLTPITIELPQYPTATTILERQGSIVPNSLEERIADQYQTIANSYGENFHFISPTGDTNFTEYILDLGKTIQARINSKYLAAATIGNGHITAWLNNQPLHTAPLTVNLVHNAMAKALLGPSYEIQVTNAPLPFTIESRFKQLNTGNNLGTQLATNLCFCMCFVSALYILFMIKERQSRFKLLQFVSGVNAWTFWLSQLFWDFLTYIITALVVIITVACFQESCFATFDELGRIFVVLFLFGLSALPFTYIVSMFFTEPAIGFARISVINIFAGMALFITITVMSIKVFNTKHIADALQWVFRIFPHYSLAQGLNMLYINCSTRKVCERVKQLIPFDTLRCKLVPECCNDVSYFGWEELGILPELVYMFITSTLFFFIIIIREYGIVGGLIHKIKQITSKPPPAPEDGYFEADVTNERDRVQNMSKNELQLQNLVLDRVSKYYGNFLAVNQLSVGVKQSECFGLLGVNGAGKTSTFKMMTGDERISFGNAYVKATNLNAKMNRIYKEIGYCPQFDAFLDDFTGREKLRIFCLLRGISNARINHLSVDLARSFGFLKHLDKQTRAYSGGSKRKLSTAIAVIGNPSVIYLDEPTTGMDPTARRQLWNLVCRLRDAGKSIVLTSHSMEECEALCTRLAIMVNGEFKCIGSTQHLKNKFSKGLILKIKLKKEIISKTVRSSTTSERNTLIHREEDVLHVKQFVEREFENSILQEQYQGILTFYIPLSSIKWSEIFGLIESNREQLNIEDYSISQTTLEEIFLEFAKHQREDARQINKRQCCRDVCSCFNHSQWSSAEDEHHEQTIPVLATR